MAFPGGPGNGQWVRARNAEGAKSFLAEQQQEADRHADEYARSRAFRRRLRARIAGMFRRRSS